MSEWNTEELITADKRFVWHPFTNMTEWRAPEYEPLILVEGHGAMLRDTAAANTSTAIHRSGRTFTATIIRTSTQPSAGSSTASPTLRSSVSPTRQRSILPVQLSIFSQQTR